MCVGLSYLFLLSKDFDRFFFSCPSVACKCGTFISKFLIFKKNDLGLHVDRPENHCRRQGRL